MKQMGEVKGYASTAIHLPLHVNDTFLDSLSKYSMLNSVLVSCRTCLYFINCVLSQLYYIFISIFVFEIDAC